MSISKIVIAGIAIAAILAVLCISGCTTVNTPIEHRQDKTVHDAAQNIDLTVTTFNGAITIEESPEYDVEVTYDITAPQGHLQHIATGTNGSRDGNTLKIIAEAKLSDTSEKLPINHGAAITVKVPKNSTVSLTLDTSNGAVSVARLNGTKMIVSTSNGRINIDAGNYSLIDATTSNGAIDVSLLPGTQFSVDASTSNGHIDTDDIAIDASHRTGTSLTGATASGKGNMSLILSTSNGHIGIAYA